MYDAELSAEAKRFAELLEEFAEAHCRLGWYENMFEDRSRLDALRLHDAKAEAERLGRELRELYARQLQMNQLLRCGCPQAVS